MSKYQPVPGYVGILEFDRNDNVRFCEGVDPSKFEIHDQKIKNRKGKKINPTLFRHVPFYPHIQASNKGYVRVIDPHTGRAHTPFHSRLNKKAFTRVQIDGKTMLVHRLIAAAWLGVKNDEYVKFRDGNRCNLIPANLGICTKAEFYDNEDSTMSQGAAGVIRKMRNEGKTIKELSEHWDLSRTMINKIINYHAWIPTGWKRDTDGT